MRSSTRQARLEGKTYAAISALETELDIDVQEYPEVIWLGRQGKFEDLGLPERYRASVEASQKSGGSIFLYRPNIIILNRDYVHHVNEEASHCFHLRNAGITLADKTKQDWFAVNILIEMFGFLGSKILDPSRKNIYKDYPDYLSLAVTKGVSFEQALDPLRDLDEDELSEFLIHSQGYGLGDRMFFALEGGQFSEDQIRAFVTKSFKEKGQATRALMQLRKGIWPIEVN